MILEDQVERRDPLLNYIMAFMYDRYIFVYKLIFA